MVRLQLGFTLAKAFLAASVNLDCNGLKACTPVMRTGLKDRIRTFTCWGIAVVKWKLNSLSPCCLTRCCFVLACGYCELCTHLELPPPGGGASRLRSRGNH
jgi:hypothetical protein